jgi:hypothetical protein
LGFETGRNERHPRAPPTLALVHDVVATGEGPGDRDLRDGRFLGAWTPRSAAYAASWCSRRATMAKAADGTCAEVDLGRVDLDEADTLAVSERNRVPVGYSRQAGEAEGAQQRVNQLP